jgi:NADP-dependent 3-hydroxy acid dehydrogenase YdfG
MTTLEGKVAVVTGASRGIGAAVARALDAAGAKLGLASRSGDDLGIPDAVALPTDVRDRAQVQTLVDATTDRHGGLDVLVANAGVGAYGPLVELDPDHLDEMIDTNVKGVLYAAAAAVPHLIARGGGDLVSVASEAGRRGLPNEAVYCASKFAQVGFTRSLDHELRPHGIRCTNVCPGGVATDFAMGDGRGRTPEMPALAGMMRAEDVAEAVLFVLTRPRSHRVLEVAFRPVTEESWG